jgi:hypothetical protein
MAFANIASATKLRRTRQIITDIGSGGFMNFYVGHIPPSPDFAPGGTLLVSLPLATPIAGVGSLAILGGAVTAPGTGGTDGTYALTITPAVSDPGTGAAGIFTVVGGVLKTIQISNNGYGYIVPPTLGGFAAGGLTGALAVPTLTAILIFGAIGTGFGVATGTTGFVRVVTSTGVGILDLDAGTTNAFSVIMNNTFIPIGSPVNCVANVLIEG